MHQLRALLWRVYKVRQRSPYTTALDVVCPILLLALYVALKSALDTLSVAKLDNDVAAKRLFRNPSDSPISVRQDLPKYMCNKVLFVSQSGPTPGASSDTSDDASFRTLVGQKCGLDLLQVANRNELIGQLKHGLDLRAAYRPSSRVDLSRANATDAGAACISLGGPQNGTIYQTGIVRTSSTSFEIHMTDLAGTSIIHAPYSQGSSYNEYKLPHSDLNSGLHLLELCLADVSRGEPDLVAYSKLRIKPYPVLTGSHVVPIMTMLMIILAHFCNTIATVQRVSEANELGQRHYIRLAGATAGYYWLSEIIFTTVHLLIQNLIISMLLAIPTGAHLADPICDTSIALRWALLVSYNLAIVAHGLCIGSMIDRCSHSILVTCLLGSCYSMFAISMMLQWSPYGHSEFQPAHLVSLLNPPATLEALLLEIYGVTMQTNEPFHLGHLPLRITGGGFTGYTIGTLWLLLIAQGSLWLLLTVVIEQLRYSTSNSWLGMPCAFVNELLFCNYFGPRGDQTVEDIKTRSTLAVAAAAAPSTAPDTLVSSMISRRDPNRICCSLRHICVKGPQIMVAQSRGDLLRLNRDQLSRLKSKEGRTMSKTDQFLVNRVQGSRASVSPSSVYRAEQPILIDEAIQQHIVWFNTKLTYEDLSVDFKFNQVTFVLGQPHLKDLLFSTILGLETIRSGHILLDGARFDSTNIGLARQQIGYLSDKDIFFNEMSIFENLQFFGSLRDSHYKNYDSESQFVLSLLHLTSRKDNLPSVLTSRSARKLALGIAAVGYTKLLLLVEPTLNLRWRPRCQVLNLLKKYKSIRSIVVDTSDIDEATAFGDRILLLRDTGVDLDGTPAQLARQLCCGYWLVFEPIGGDGQTINSESIKNMERFSDQLFKKDKLDLDATRRSLFHSRIAAGHPNAAIVATKTSQHHHEDLNRAIVVLKVRQSEQSMEGLCKLMRLFEQSNPHGFRLVELKYESIEDTIVHRMSRAVYPELPPDLLLSLRHRTQANRANSRERSPVSVRKCSDNSRQQVLISGASGAIFRAGLHSIIRDRVIHKTEILITLLALIVSITIITITLFAVQSSFANQDNNYHHQDHHNGRLATATKTGRFLINKNDIITNHHSISTTNGDRDATTIQVDHPTYDLLANSRETRNMIPAASSTATPTSTSSRRAGRGDGGWGSGGLEGREGHARASWLPFGQLGLRHVINNNDIQQLYKNRIGFYVLDSAPGNTSEARDALNQVANHWQGNLQLIGLLKPDSSGSDASQLASLVYESKDLATSFIFYDPKTSDTTIVFEPYLPHAMFSAVRAFIDYKLSSPPWRPGLNNHSTTTNQTGNNNTGKDNNSTIIAHDNKNNSHSAGRYHETLQLNHHELKRLSGNSSSTKYKTSRYNFHQPWHEMIRGLLNRRYIYGIGFAIAESIAIGVMVIAPIRHRSESTATQVNLRYWLGMALFDMIISLILILAYIVLFVLIESSGSMIVPLFIVLLLYKIASLPIPYIISLAASSSLYSFLFILLVYVTICWEFSIHVKTFIEYTLINNSYLYKVSSWIIGGTPIGSLVEALVIINQVGAINRLCPIVPAYTATKNIVPLEGIQRYSMIDSLLEKVSECLANGKTGISTDVFHQDDLGILWCIYLISLFGLIGWIFLLTCERLFGLLARKFNSAKTSNDPLRNAVRFPDKTTSLFQWDRERDRLVSEYIRCLNEPKYVKSMSTNCLMLRVWLRPMSDQESFDKRLSGILEPLYSMGHSKNDIQIELKTTLQIFIRVGDEFKPCKVNRVQLIEAYSMYSKKQHESIAKIAITNWTQDSLYKILLHGHYNTKSMTIDVQ